ncbi:MAG: hypothetical protein A3G97_15130 [Candidatus Rokubacteria bacterium RIFCSPLOWO2_12_FULL_69_21]|nr:MAG: hypothetical protein A3G97_15130 [Candidatus Rokubacteria bacterium RIFCSPLOWO2_12_FULL_69_21]
MGLLHERAGLRDLRSLDFLTTRRLHILTARGLDFLSTGCLHFLAARRLDFLSTGCLHFLAARSLDFLTTRRLHFLAARRLDLLRLGGGLRALRSSLLLLQRLLRLLQRRLGLSQLRGAFRRRCLSPTRIGEGHAHQAQTECRHEKPLHCRLLLSPKYGVDQTNYHLSRGCKPGATAGG